MPATPPKPDEHSLSNHPLNLLLRFLLELGMLAALGYWGWTQHDGILRVLLAVGLPVSAATLWGIFRVNGDPKDAPVVIPGVLRLLLEWGLFAAAVAALWAADQTTAALVFAALVVFHYAISYEHVRWKIAQR